MSATIEKIQTSSTDSSNEKISKNVRYKKAEASTPAENKKCDKNTPGPSNEIQILSHTVLPSPKVFSKPSVLNNPIETKQSNTHKKQLLKKPLPTKPAVQPSNPPDKIKIKKPIQQSPTLPKTEQKTRKKLYQKPTLKESPVLETTRTKRHKRLRVEDNASNRQISSISANSSTYVPNNPQNYFQKEPSDSEQTLLQKCPNETDYPPSEVDEILLAHEQHSEMQN